MSLKRWIDAGKQDGVAPIAPELAAKDVTAMINDKKAVVKGINRVKEFVTEENVLDAYLIHIDPSGIPTSSLLTQRTVFGTLVKWVLLRFSSHLS